MKKLNTQSPRDDVPVKSTAPNLLFLPYDGTTRRTERRPQRLAHRHVQLEYQSQKCKSMVQPSATSTRDTSTADISVVVPIYRQPDGFDPFHSLASDAGGLSSTQELLTWFTARIKKKHAASNRMVELHTSAWRGFWGMTMCHAVLYHNMAAVIYAPSTSPSAADGRALYKYFQHRALALQCLRRALATDDYNQATFLSIALQLNFAIREDDEEGAKAHANALRLTTTPALVQTLRPMHWKTYLIIALRYAQWTLRPPVIGYEIHPFCHFEHIVFSNSPSSRLIRRQTMAVLDKLPVVSISTWDTATMHSMFYRMFWYTEVSSGSYGVGPMLGLFFNLAYDLSVCISVASTSLDDGLDEKVPSFQALYCVLLASQLSLWASHTEVTSAGGSTTTVATGRTLDRLVWALKKQSDVCDYWNSRASLECLTWVVFTARAHEGLFKGERSLERRHYLVDHLGKTLIRLQVKTFQEWTALVELFPSTPIWSSDKMTEIWQSLNLEHCVQDQNQNPEKDRPP